MYMTSYHCLHCDPPMPHIGRTLRCGFDFAIEQHGSRGEAINRCFRQKGLLITCCFIVISQEQLRVIFQSFWRSKFWPEVVLDSNILIWPKSK